MKKEKQQDREREQMIDLLMNGKGFPDLKIVQHIDQPDFIMCDGSRRIGVEFTEFHRDMPGDNGSKEREINELRSKALEKCRQLTSDLGKAGPMIYVQWIPVQTDHRLATDAFAAAANKLVRANLPAEGQVVELTFADLCCTGLEHQCARITIYGSTGRESGGWYDTGAGWIDVQPAVLEKLIAEKNMKVPGYRSDVAEQWLVIIAWPDTFASYNDISTALDTEYQSAFQRVYFFDAWHGQVHLLKTTAVI